MSTTTTRTPPRPPRATAQAARRTRAGNGSARSRAADDFYKRLRAKVARWSERKQVPPAYRDALLALPDLVHLVTKLMLDRRVSALDKTILGVALAYTVSPVDLVPDWLGPVGFMDDVLIVALALSTVLERAPAAVIAEHWAGDADLMKLVRNTLDSADRWLGKNMFERIREFLHVRVQALGRGRDVRSARRAPVGGGARASAGAEPRTRATSRPRSRSRSAAVPEPATPPRRRAAAPKPRPPRTPRPRTKPTGRAR